MSHNIRFRVVSLVSAMMLLMSILVQPVHAVTFQTDIQGPVGSSQFGTSVTTLPNGNFVVTDPYYDAPGPVEDVGAVYLYNGATHALISTLTGSTAGDQVGSSRIIVLTNGNYVVQSPHWHNGAATDAGAVTWGSGTTGVSGVVSAANSLVGSTAGDAFLCSTQPLYCDESYVTVLTSGNYVLASPGWDNGAAKDAGAVTWGSGATGVSGVVSAANSLVGSTAGDQVGISGYITVLTNGNYVVASPLWHNSPATRVSAVTWGSGTSGVSGVVSAANSLVGSFMVTALPNGNYVVANPYWDNGTAWSAGAVTWGNGTTGVTGVISPANSLVGSTAGDHVGSGIIIALTNGNYLVRSLDWDNGSVTDAGAVTWGNGTIGVSGVISAANSLVGSTAGDHVGHSYGNGVLELTNGNYVVQSIDWDNGVATDAGAATWGNGETGVTGVISSANSLVGSTAGDWVGFQATALPNGNYVVKSPYWDNGVATDAGAVTWGDGTTGVSGVVSAANSLVGSTAGDAVGSGVITALTNGNYVVRSPGWDNGTVADVGAVTWGDGTTGVSGVVSAANSLIGSTAGDQDGYFSIIAPLTNGNYVVVSPYWDNGAAVDAGAVTWGDGTSGVTGVISAANSLVGSTAGDGFICFPLGHGYSCTHGDFVELTNGNYVVGSRSWDNGAAVDAGAVTWGDGTTGVSGVISAANSLVGSTTGDELGRSVIALTNGNYVVGSLAWDNGTVADVGAVTWGNGTSGVTGVVSAANSLVGWYHRTAERQLCGGESWVG